MAGTPYFMSPEILSGEYGPKCDIWALGIVLYMIVCGELPFTGSDRASVQAKIKLGKYKEPTLCSEECRDLIQKMMSTDDKKRPSAAEALEHPWFKHIKNSEINTLKVSQNVLQQMKKFKGVSKLRKSALIMLVKILDSTEIKELKKVFEQIDTDNSGIIDALELKRAINKSKVKISEREVQELIDNIDNNDNTQIDYTEFIASTIDLGKVLTVEKIQALFNCFDVDHQGQINACSIKSAFTKFGRNIADEDVEEIMRLHDGDNNALIDLDEFTKMMMLFKT